MNLTKFGTRASAVVVAAVAGYSSYRHIFEVATSVREDFSVALVMPLSIDGLVVVASLAMLEDKRAGCQPRLSARLALAFGVVATLMFNLGSAEPTWQARAVAAVPAVAFLAAVEVLSRSGRRKAAGTDPVPPAVAEPVATPDEVGTTDTTPGPAPAEPAELPVKVKPTRKPRADKTAGRVRRAAAEMPAGTSFAEIAAKAKVSESTARRHLTGGQEDDQPQARLLIGELLVPDAEMPPVAASNGHAVST